jgi:hypothetical protein
MFQKNNKKKERQPKSVLSDLVRDPAKGISQCRPIDNKNKNDRKRDKQQDQGVLDESLSCFSPVETQHRPPK